MTNVTNGSESRKDEEIAINAEESRIDRLEKELAEIKKHLKPNTNMTDEEKEEKLKGVIFDDSTHRLLFMKEVELPTGESHTVTGYDSMLSFVVIVWQCICYGVFFHLVRSLAHEDLQESGNFL